VTLLGVSEKIGTDRTGPSKCLFLLLQENRCNENSFESFSVNQAWAYKSILQCLYESDKLPAAMLEIVEHIVTGTGGT